MPGIIRVARQDLCCCHHRVQHRWLSCITSEWANLPRLGDQACLRSTYVFVSYSFYFVRSNVGCRYIGYTNVVYGVKIYEVFYSTII